MQARISSMNYRLFGRRAHLGSQLLPFMLMIGGAALLSWLGTTVFLRANSITTVKPFCGVILAIVSIYGHKHLPRILVAGFIGGVIGKLVLGSHIWNALLNSGIASAAIFATYSLGRRYIGPVVDFRVWKQLIAFMCIAALVSAASAVVYTFVFYQIVGGSLIAGFQSWWLPTTLSFAVFTPVVVLWAKMDGAAINQNKYRALAGFGLLVGALVANFIPFSLPALFLIPLALMIISLTCEVEGAAIGLAITEIMITTAAVLGHSITALARLSLAQQLYFTQLFVGALILVILPAASAIGERRRLHDGMKEALQREADIAAALRESEQRYRLMADHASDVMLQTDADGRIVYISPSSKRLTGYDPSEMIGTMSDQNIADLDKQWIRDTKKELLRTGSAGGLIAYRVRHKDGPILWCENRFTFMRDEDGEYRGMFGIVRDITEREAIKHELICARERAEAANSAKSEFLANMSHEIRTPLTSVIGFADLLYEHGSLNEQARGFAARVRNGAHSLLALINDVLDYSKLESGLISLSPTPTNVMQLVSEVFDLLSIQAKTKGLELNLECSAGVRSAAVSVDALRLRQVLINLVGNAIKFTETGFVTLLITCTEESGIDSANRLCCRVIDSGEGIPASHLADIFERFSQVDSTTSKRHRGTGLGLAICKGLVEAMDGTIGVISEPGQGSTFWFEIAAPLSEGQKIDKKRERPQAKVEKRGALVVDDQEGNRTLARIALTALGVHVVEAESGEEAVALAADLQFDLILMDIRMPGMSGTDAMKAIRKANSAKFPIVAFTAEGEQKMLDALVQEGFTATLSKPLTLSELKSCIVELLASNSESVPEIHKHVA
jgi:PAS domain S-box-containing protein